jgi:hypothetical protein
MEEDECLQVLTLKGMADMFRLWAGYLACFDEKNPNRVRSAKVSKEASACYRELCQEKQRCLVLSLLDKFFRKQDSTIST